MSSNGLFIPDAFKAIGSRADRSWVRNLNISMILIKIMCFSLWKVLNWGRHSTQAASVLLTEQSLVRFSASPKFIILMLPRFINGNKFVESLIMLNEHQLQVVKSFQALVRDNPTEKLWK